MSKLLRVNDRLKQVSSDGSPNGRMPSALEELQDASVLVKPVTVDRKSYLLILNHSSSTLHDLALDTHARLDKADFLGPDEAWAVLVKADCPGYRLTFKTNGKTTVLGGR